MAQGFSGLRIVPEGFLGTQIGRVGRVNWRILLVLVSLLGSMPASFGADEDVLLFQGQHVKVQGDGTVQIHQERYPDYKRLLQSGHQLFGPIENVVEMDGKYYQGVGSWTIQDGMPFRKLEEIDPNKGFLQTSRAENESTVDKTKFPDEVLGVRMKESPCFSCGRMTMSFKTSTNEGEYCGSAAAIDKNLLVTAAHNFMPDVLFKKENSGRVRAHKMKFEHLCHVSPSKPSSLSGSYGHYLMSGAYTDCFIHPKWGEKFDSQFDIAFVFLSEAIYMTPEEKENLLRLHILDHQSLEDIQVVGYPSGKEHMMSTMGGANAFPEGSNDVLQIIYHTANTESGSSGSPIVHGKKSLVGVHTFGLGEGAKFNGGVRIRHDLMPFLEESIRIHQAHLKDAEAERLRKEKELEEEKCAYEEKLKAEGSIEGEKRGEKRGREDQARETALKLIATGKVDDETIMISTGLDADEFRTLKEEWKKQQAESGASV